MNNKNEIDQLLKESFDNFSPEAPDVWQAVQQGVQAAQAAGAASSGVVGASVQGAGLMVKIVAGVAIVATAVTGYIVYHNQVSQPATSATTTTAVIQENAPAQPEPLTKTANTTPEAGMEQETKFVQPKQDNQHSLSQPVKQLPVVHAADKTQADASMPGSESTPQPEVKDNLPVNVPVTRDERTGTEEPKSTGTVHGNDAEKTGTTPTTTTPKMPYNPYAEEGEEYEKPNIPGSMSPNNDGLNDRFEIGIENEAVFALKIYDEKGELVFESKNKSQMWDGKHYKTGVLCPLGKYMYILNYQYKGSDQGHQKRGYVIMF